MKIYCSRGNSDESLINSIIGKDVWLKMQSTKSNNIYYIRIIDKVDNKYGCNLLLINNVLNGGHFFQIAFEVATEKPVYLYSINNNFKVIHPYEMVTTEEIMDAIDRGDTT